MTMIKIGTVYLNNNNNNKMFLKIIFCFENCLFLIAEVADTPQIQIVGHHPTKAVIQISNYETATEYQKPTKIELKHRKNDGASEEPVDWNTVPDTITYNYGKLISFSSSLTWKNT